MNKNVRIAKQLVKLAKSLVAENNYLFSDLHDVEVNDCYMTGCFDRLTFDSDYQRIGDYEDGTYLYGSLCGKKPSDIFDLDGWADSYKEDWKQFFSEASENLNNCTHYDAKLNDNYGYVIARGNSQSDWAQVIYDKSEVQNAQAFFDDFFYGYQLCISITIDGEEYDNYDVIDNLSDYSKQKVIDSLKVKLGDKFSNDIESQLNNLLPEDDKIEYADF